MRHDRKERMVQRGCIIKGKNVGGSQKMIDGRLDRETEECTEEEMVMSRKVWCKEQDETLISFFSSNFNLSVTLINRWCTHTQTHGCEHILSHTAWWKCYLSIFQLNVLISLVAHGCLGKQQSQLQKAASIHLRDCQSVRHRAEASALPETHGCTIFF